MVWLSEFNGEPLHPIPFLFLAGKSVEIINKDASREKTKEVDELSSGSQRENRAIGLMQNSNKLQQGVHMHGQVFQIQGNKLVQYGLSVKWRMDGGSEDSGMLLGQSVDSKQDQKEARVVANETNSSYIMDEESDGNLEDSAMLNEPSAHLCVLRKRSAEYGQVALEDRISKEWDSSRLTKSQRLLLFQVFETSLPKK
ncbi:uncharacterized protein LOC110032288 [Phalaenopsis equestris]|uniref:uncharacterized protein LOC110032288 n=1 Tax=Phalaenopsis equestris TaxID=78828 RepID=UPI0009E4AE54|nr:uncharacterized protein LOC110032288 [Phalaenopsis equestris]